MFRASDVARAFAAFRALVIDRPCHRTGIRPKLAAMPAIRCPRLTLIILSQQKARAPTTPQKRASLDTGRVAREPLIIDAALMAKMLPSHYLIYNTPLAITLPHFLALYT